jgi:transcriptional regulator with XRE-family HTH domain
MHHARPVTETFAAFLRPFLLGDSANEIARKLGMQQTTWSRQLQGNMPIGTVVRLCRVYSIPMLDAFVAAGFITDTEAEVMGRSRGLRQATERELLAEMMRRVENGTATAALTEPVEQELVDEVAARRARQDVGRLDEADVHADEAKAANHDDSAEGLDPETT